VLKNKISVGIMGILRSFHIVNKLVIIALIIVSSLWGQTYEISGTVLDETGKKLGSARLTLYNSKHYRVKKENTKGNGKFKFKKIKPDKYTLNIYGANGNSATKEIDLRSSSVTKLEITTSQDEKQAQLRVSKEVGKVILKWDPIKSAAEYIIFRDNTELTKTTKPTYTDEVSGGKSYAYNVTVIDNNGEKGTRSLTEWGKSKLMAPENIKAKANKNNITLSWGAVNNASGYNIYRDDDKINSTTETEYTDYKLKYNEDYSYLIVATDHHQKQGKKSSEKSIKTHKKVKKIKKIKAKSWVRV
jgi:Fibronectin type 3 domain-containing protein